MYRLNLHIEQNYGFKHLIRNDNYGFEFLNLASKSATNTMIKLLTIAQEVTGSNHALGYGLKSRELVKGWLRPLFRKMKILNFKI